MCKNDKKAWKVATIMKKNGEKSKALLMLTQDVA